MYNTDSKRIRQLLGMLHDEFWSRAFKLLINQSTPTHPLTHPPSPSILAVVVILLYSRYRKKSIVFVLRVNYYA